MNEYHLIASNDHFTKREKNIDINKLKAVFAASEFTDLLANVDDQTLQDLRNQPCFIADDGDRLGDVILSGRYIYKIDDAGKMPLEKIDIPHNGGLNFGHVITHKGYRLAFINNGPAVILKDWTKLCYIQLDYCWLFKSPENDGDFKSVKGKSAPVVVGNCLYFLFGKNKSILAGLISTGCSQTLMLISSIVWIAIEQSSGHRYKHFVLTRPRNKCTQLTSQICTYESSSTKEHK